MSETSGALTSIILLGILHGHEVIQKQAQLEGCFTIGAYSKFDTDCVFIASTTVTVSNVQIQTKLSPFWGKVVNIPFKN